METETWRQRPREKKRGRDKASKRARARARAHAREKRETDRVLDAPKDLARCPPCLARITLDVSPENIH